MTREPDPASRRTLRLALTDTGCDLAPRLAEIADRNDAHFFAGLDPVQRHQLEEWIRRLLGEAHPQPTPPHRRPPERRHREHYSHHRPLG
ncbi:hypothetical protein J7E99_20775 [Streptomyces sp. ISL-44]|uniref:hypothetical protein n=1 Tax=Streptomyces sp. ISL-44 TaxID=2819184 RepID=UPI001BE5E798|nr:hypothetical protein [Streptomyces sp. ISL-44]MBT2543072.1 hypothetical protein [Streptomyces sp. ISL-44]